MIVEDIFNQLASHMQEGMMFHCELMKGYEFLNLEGYRQQQRHQYLEETKNYLELIIYYSEHYNKIINFTQPVRPPAIPETWYKYSRDDVDIDTRRKAIKDFLEKWVKWEQDTKKLLQTSYKELQSEGEIASSLFLNKFICDVDEELRQAHNELLELRSINYDMTIIIERQKKLCHKYKE